MAAPSTARGRLRLAALASALLFAGPAAAQTEYQVKGAMLYNIARFVDWPRARRGQTAVQLCVLGTDPFGRDLDAFDGRPIGQGVLKIRRVARTEDAGLCNMLFVPSAEAARLPGVLGALRGRPVLTISESPGGAEKGAVLNLILEQNHVRFEINIDAAQRSGLTISSQLLKLARITHDRT